MSFLASSLAFLAAHMPNLSSCVKPQLRSWMERIGARQVSALDSSIGSSLYGRRKDDIDFCLP